MPLPNAIAGALVGVDATTYAGNLATEKVCEGAKFHSPNPLVLYDVEGHTLCGTCRGNFLVLRALLAHHKQQLAWPVQREFGNRLRGLLIPKESDG